MKAPVRESERIHVSETPVWSTVRDIAESGVQEDAFYVCDLGDIVRKYQLWRHLLPRVEPHYAVKCNDTPLMVEVLAALGSSFDCASKGEIDRILDLGVDPAKIIFANPCKMVSHIRHAAHVGVQWMTFDNETELHKVKCIYPHAKMVIRIRCDAASAQCPLGAKFGCDAVKEAPRLLQLALVLGIDVVGVSFHVGSGCRDPPVFRTAISVARNIFDLAASLGFNFHILDIGGGFPGNKGTSLDKIADVVNSALEEFFPDPCVHVIAEPGRYMAASAFTLATNIHSKRTVMGAGGAHHMYYINDGVYGSFNSLLYDHAVAVPMLLKETGGALHSSSIWGPTCDSLDQVCDNVPLPELNIGDWVVFEDMGAYTLPVASPFNGFPLSKVHTIATEAVWDLLKSRVSFLVDDQTEDSDSDMNCKCDILPSDSLEDIRHLDNMRAGRSLDDIHHLGVDNMGSVDSMENIHQLDNLQSKMAVLDNMASLEKMAALENMALLDELENPRMDVLHAAQELEQTTYACIPMEPVR